MKYSTTILFGVSLAVVAGLFGSGLFGISATKADNTNLGTTGLITGHVTTTLTDSEGIIKEYRQSDNMIVNQGENCALKMLFATGGGAATGNSVCVGANTAGFRYVGIGNGSSTPIAAPVANDYKLYNPHNSTSFGTTSAMIRQFGAVGLTGWTNSTGALTTSAASVVMSSVFTNGNGAGHSSITVNESGIFNATDGTPSTDAMFARQTFTAITMAPGDSLTVQWTINVGGTSSALSQTT